MIAQLTTETLKRAALLLAVCTTLALTKGCESSTIEVAGSTKIPDQKTAASDKVHRFTDANFSAQVLKSKEPVLVDFWATWCGPCRRLTPIIKQLAHDYKDEVKVGKLDVDQNNKTARTYSIRGIPDVALFKNGKIVARLKGLHPKKSYQDLIKAHLQ